MNFNPLRERLSEDRVSFGIFVSELRSPWLGAMLGATGYDFCILDMEHGAFSLPEISSLLAGFQGSSCTPIVRVPAMRRDIVTPLLDLGVGGIMVPNVETAEEARLCVELTKYPPLGSRGLSLSRPHTGFTATDRDRFLADANERNLLIVQIESPRALENLDDILIVSGIDVAFVGCADLSLSMGIPNDPATGLLRNALELVIDTANRNDVFGGANITKQELIETLSPRGLRMITVTTDTKGFVDGITRSLQPLKQFSPEIRR